ncbi:MAG: GDSL-type esterase/lipase family protein [Planctomycetota bacterium]
MKRTSWLLLGVLTTSLCVVSARAADESGSKKDTPFPKKVLKTEKRKSPRQDKILSEAKANPAMKPIQDEPGLPRVLLIGDSISIGYTLPTRELLKGKANVHRIPVNGGTSQRGVESLADWLGEGPWDLVHFNFGLHDLKIMPDGKQQISLEQYSKNLEKVVEGLKKSGAVLVWASTTPVPEGELNPGRSNKDVEAYNAAALEVMKRQGVLVDDLYAFAKPKLAEIQLPNNVHFSKEGSAVLAQEVSNAILAHLPKSAGDKKDAAKDSDDKDTKMPTGFLEREFKDEEGTHKYVLFVPSGYTPDKKWPLILFLHGAGERGTDNKAQVATGLGPAVKKRAKDFPFLVIFPQCGNQKVPPVMGWSPEGDDGKRALEILDAVEKEYSTDKDRTYLTGLSMGGFGTWAFAAKFPDRWAAIAPVCGGGSPDIAAKIKHIPVWAFHGDQDRAVAVVFSRNLVDALKKNGAEPRYTEYPGVGHNSWDNAYNTDELYDWFLEHPRKSKSSE